ncbi:hypothetical protein DL546_008134 [Coniochaeta pulveracea]|uniref:Uncharacterized protein n=1 Tax=Coniochaeta pulveracea TaxID=177199 RepID=A0A420YNR2_9PEZI|nr:hypothetical protein DL546_008134 [Coniochaeta pulveracea]
MTPPVHSFPALELPLKVQLDDKGRKRKTEGGAPIQLSACELLGFPQYHCSIDRPELRNSPVRCWPVQRWFRRCQDKNGSFMVETTAWEGSTTMPELLGPNKQVNHWTPSSVDSKKPPPRIF